MTVPNTKIDNYGPWLAELKTQIQSARSRAALAVNQELVHLYHRIGTEILQQQRDQGWGAKVIDRLSSDLRAAFPEMRGFSTANLKYMRYFADQCPNSQIGQQAADQLPWFHIVTLLTKVADPETRGWYAAEAVRVGWSRASLEASIHSRAHTRQGAALNNFSDRLPASQATLATQVLKDPYHFDFLGLGDEAHEVQIEAALVTHIQKFLLELGQGFAFIGRQHRVEVAGDEFFIDLLFYHLHLRCYVVVELKATEFRPEHVGQLNFYLAAIDAQLKRDNDQPTIGLLLCRSQNRLVAEYALSGTLKPMGVAEYQLMQRLPDQLQSVMPTTTQLEEELSRALEVFPVDHVRDK